jgi:predicted ATPase
VPYPAVRGDKYNAGVATTNVPARSTSFVGRQSDLETLRETLAGGVRLLTVLGPGGIGKTRVALELARGALERFDEVWFCDLSEAQSAIEVLGAVARGLDVALESSTGLTHAIDALAGAIAARGTMLLVLDNFEQVVEESATTVVPLIERAPRLQLLVTSRERLRVSGEYAHDLTALTEEDAMNLFVERARAVLSDYDPKGEIDTVRAICRELDGLPLAIELAAARIRVLSAAELASRLSARFELLTSSQRGAVPRHATLRAALDWSWELLSEAEQSVLAQCSVFEGGFTLEAADEVIDVDGSVLEVLSALRDKSLVLQSSPQMRFGMYVTVREYARERLVATGGEPAALERHALYYLKRGMSWAARAEGGKSAEARAFLSAEQANFLAVHRRALEHPRHHEHALRAALVLQPELITKGPAALRLDVLDRALACVPTERDPVTALLEGWCLVARADGLLHWGRLEEAEASFGPALAAAREHGDPHLEARCRWRLGSLCWLRAENARAREHVEQALPIFQRAGDRVHEGRAFSSLGLFHADRGALDEARQCYERALAIHEDNGDRRWHGTTTSRLGELEDHAGRADEARRLYELALVTHRAQSNRRHEAQTLFAQAALEHELGRPERARELCEQGLAMHRHIADRRAEAVARALLGVCAFDLGDSDTAATRFDEAHGIAQRLGNRRLVALVAAWRVPLELSRNQADTARSLVEMVRSTATELEDGVLGSVGELTAAYIEAVSGDREGARAMLDAQADQRSRSTLVRRAAIVAERALDRGPPGDVLVIAANGAWFQPAGGDRVDLQSRRSLRLVLCELARRRSECPGEPTDIEQLFAIGWPGERARREAALSRVYVALSTLRKLGLRGVLIKRDDGYLLDERIRVERWT